MRFWSRWKLRDRVKNEAAYARNWMRHFLSFSVIIRQITLAFFAIGCFMFVPKAFPSHFWSSPVFLLTVCFIGGILSGATEVVYFAKPKAHNSGALPKVSHFIQTLLLIIPERNRDHIIGDLAEEYHTCYKRFPNLWCLWQVVVLVASYWWAALRRLADLDAIHKMIRK